MNKSYLSSVSNPVLSLKPSKAIRLLLMVLFVCLFSNVASAQCNGDAGAVQSNSDQLCVGSAENFWSNGWGGGIWSSSNSSVLAVVQNKNGGNPTVTAIASGTADVIYTYKQSGCPDKISRKTIVVSNALGTTGSISGITPQCSGTTNQVYSIPSVANATKYVWTVPSGWIITSGQNTSSIVVTTSSNSGNLTVTVSNDCKTNNAEYTYVNITNSKTTTPTIIASGTTSFCAGNNVVLTSSEQDNYLWSNGATTRSITVTSSGNYLVKTTKNGYYCPSDASTSIPVTVNPSSVGGTVSLSQTICSNTQPSNITLMGYIGSIQWQVSSNNSTYATIPGATASTLTSAQMGVLTATRYYRAEVKSGSCSLVYSAPSAVTVSAPSAPLVGTRIHPKCALQTGSVTLSGLPTVNWTINPGAITGSTASKTISGLAAGTYNFTVTIDASGCKSPASADVVINAFVAVTNKYTTSWSLGTPTPEQHIEFAADYYNQNEDVEACSCTVNAEVYVNIESEKTLTLTNEIIVNGTILFKDKSSLIQLNNLKNTFIIEYERKISNTIRKTDYTYWSSPVASFQLGDVYPSNTTGSFYSYGVKYGIEDWQQESSSTEMVPGKGYIINGAKPGSGPSDPPTTNPFEGVPNNGDITVPIGYNGAAEGTSNLLGNPYPSAIDADKFLAANADVLDGTLYFWTHNTALNLAGNITNPGPGWAYTYSLNDYASYNLTGGVGVENAKGGVSAPSGTGYPVLPNAVDLGKKPSGKIASGQGFFATSIKSGNVKFTNAMRVGGDGASGNNSQFFKTKNPKGKTANTIEKNRVWLNLSNTEGAFKQTLIGYVTDATNDYDNLFDGQSFDANEFVDFYSVYQDKNLVIQGRALPFEETDEVQLGFRTTIDGTFTINIDQVDGVLTNQAVFIEDKLTNTIFDLKSGNYTFRTTPGTFNDRFVLRYNNKTLGAENFDSLANKVLVSNANKQIKINSFAETIDKVVIYDLLGRQVFQKTNVNNNELSIANLISNHQTLVVKTLLQNGNTFTDKIIY